ncbi:Venom allergen 3 [Amphibalanus amphitrite]|uniref:Venom allergen 3 n=1 Tax=Amphibalanus amphitrite TaxID=1232801 RepID=A0A6A4WLQ6_AMPAM|nr:Venom allergen 3 [Amphibalanus amphitrite]
MVCSSHILSLLVAGCLLASAAAAGTNYCTGVTCPSGTQHTMCLYPSAGPSSSCSQPNAAASTVSAADISEILAAHNTIREAVRTGKYASNNLPAASEMPPLAWDAELATVAQRWADQCQQSHDQCRAVPRFAVGQNAAWTWGHAKNWTGRAIGQWFHDELPHFQQSNLTFTQGTDRVSGQIIGHLTQVIWASTTLVGCGYTETVDTDFYNLTKRAYFCNYGPAGNFIGQQIYRPEVTAAGTTAPPTATPSAGTTGAPTTHSSC